MATQPHTLVTAEQFYQLPQEEGREFELLDGEVVEMSSPTVEHNLIITAATGLLLPAVRGKGMLLPNTDFSDGRMNTLRPDLTAILGDKCALVDPKKLPVDVPPDIVLEVISPSESAFRVERRINAYLRFGVQEVWIVYHEDRNVYVHSQQGVTRLRATDALSTPLLPGWSITVNQLFER